MSKKIGTKITSSILLCSMLAYTMPVLAYTKEESVYSKLDANGTVYKTTVSDQLKNTEKETILKDLSDLMNIENVSGDQELNQENNSLTWKAEGEDIYYQGTTEKELPIECKISYELDGEEISKEDIVGKTGKVKITLEYTNKEQREVTINGQKETMYVPFVVGIGTIIDNENNKNIEISSGKVIDDGTKTMVFGIALPGMQESLGLSEDEIEIPSKIEITMEAKDFEMNAIYCFATPKLIEENDLDLDKLNEIYDMANELKSASTQLVDGSKQLSDGANKLNEGTQELSNALNTEINNYSEIRKQLANKEEIESKIVSLVNDEIKKLAPELEELAEQEASNVIKANKEIIEEKTTETALVYADAAIEGELKEIENNKEGIIKISSELLTQIEKDVQTALKNITEKDDIKALEETIKKAIVADVTNSVKTTTEDVITNAVENKKKEITDPTKNLSTEDAATLKASEAAIVKAMVPGIKAQYEAKGVTLTDEQAQAKAQEAVSTLVTTVSKETMDATLDTVATEAPTMAENAVKGIAAELNTNEALEKAISDYEEKIVAEITASVGEETLQAIEQNIQKEIVEELINTFENDETLKAQIQQYGSAAKAKLNATIDNVAESTAKTLASELSEDLAQQIASNLIKKQLSGELSETEIDKELSKYEDAINSKLNEVDSQISTLKVALNQLTDGTNELSKGANELSEGMSKFDNEGIEKIYNLVNGNVKDIQARLEKLQDLAEEYNTFTMMDENAEGSVKFIMMIDGLKQEETKEEVILPSEIEEEKE